VRSVTTLVIGAGQCGLAMSRQLTDRSIDHVVLERGTVANTWKTERWDSLRLLTPNWQSRLPGLCYDGPDPDGFMGMPEVVDLLERYASLVAAPVQEHTTVTSVRPLDSGYEVATDDGVWRCRSVVLASGACNIASVPAVSSLLPAGVTSVTPARYRRPGDLPDGGVLVVGASATGVQLADEIHASGRPVTLAVGEHVRVPRTYRGRDVQWWMESAGLHDQRYDDIEDLNRARNLPSMQLVGTPERVTLDLNALRSRGVRMVGRIAGVNDGKAQFSGSLRNVCALADLKMNRLLDTFDTWATEAGIDGELEPPCRYPDTVVDDAPALVIDLAREGIRTVLWATGFRPDHSWLGVPVLDRKGRLRHDGGVVDAPGLYAMGLPFLRRRKSSLIDGAGDDARDLAEHLAGYLDRSSRA
jgi:putative flavoprotein involved in K+ transport